MTRTPSHVHPAIPESPQPSVRAMQERLATELSLRSRVLYTLLLLVDLAIGAVVASLWLTEPDLPTRTHIAFGVLLLIAIVWAVVFGWTLARRKVLLAKHRVVTSRIAVFFCAVFTAGALAVAFTDPDLRQTGLFAAGFGGVLVAVAAVLWRRAAQRYRELVERTRRLERDLGSPTVRSLLPGLLIGASLLGAAGATDAQILTSAPLEIRAASAPVPAIALDRFHLVYELHVTSFSPEPRRLEELAVLDAATDRVLGSWFGPKLAQRLIPVGSRGEETGDPLVLGSGARAVVFVWLALDPRESLPSKLRHRLTTSGTQGESQESLTETWTGEIAVGSSDLPLDRVPVGSGRWVAIRGPSNTSGHRRSLVALDGGVWVAQRFAVDWARLGDDGRLFRGEGVSNEDWYGFGEPVHASRAGRVARVIRGVPDHPPRSPEIAKFARRDIVSGNTVVVDEGDGRFAVYAHLREGSTAVHEGETVEAGAVLGAIGNSGHSLAPHLHFHIGTTADPLASEGLPFALDEFRLIGRLDSLASALAGTPWKPDPRRPARTVRGELPLENMVVELGPSSPGSTEP